MSPAPVQRSFASGELAPALYARTDLARYVTGLRTCRNMIVTRDGGVTIRPGTAYVATVKDSSAACRLIPFVLDATDINDTFLLEFGNGYVRFHQDGAPVVVTAPTAWATATAYALGDLVSQGAVNYYCISAHTSATGTDKPGVDAGAGTRWYALTGVIYEIPTPYQTADLPDLQFQQSGDVVTLVHPSYVPRELRRYSATRWTLVPVVEGPSIAAPTGVAATGGVVGVDTYYAVTAVKEVTNEESLAGVYKLVGHIPAGATPVALTWNAVPGAVAYNVFRSYDGTTYALIQGVGGALVAGSDTAWTDSNEVATSSDSAQYVSTGATQMLNALAAITAVHRASDGNYTVKFRTTLASGAASVGPTWARVAIYYKRNTESTRILSGRVGIGSVFGANQSSGPMSTTVTVQVPDNGYTALQIELVPEIKAAPGGSACSLTIDANTAPDNAVSWTEGVAGFSDANGAADYSIAPPIEPALFDAVTRYPTAVGVYQQRRFFGNTSEAPEQVWGSRIGVYTSFTTSTPLEADDSVSFAIAGKRANVVRHLLDLTRLLVFGADAVTAIDGDDSGALTPDSINPRKVARQGIGRLHPLEVGDSAVYVQGRGSIVRDLQPVQTAGQLGGYQGNDLTVFASHLFDGYTIADWAYAETPHSIVWAVRSDGVLLGLTYVRDQAIWAWHRHDTDGTFENVCVLPEGSEDAIYVVVKRTVNGSTKRYIERFTARSVTDVTDLALMDASLSYDGWAAVGTKTVLLSGGVTWDQTETVTATASSGIFAASNVGDSVVLLVGGSLVRCAITAYTSATVVTVRADRPVPTSMQGVAIGNGAGEWALAVATVSGLDHLEGESLSVFADGFVAASPNNIDANGNLVYPEAVVTAGAISLSRAYAVIHAGLPYIADFVPLERDAVDTTVRDKEALHCKCAIRVDRSRGIWIGPADKPTAAKPLNGLQQYKARESEGYDDPPALLSRRLEITFDGRWDKTDEFGPFLIRQVDPLPLSILSIAPIGYGV